MDSTDLPSSEIPDSEWNPHAQSVREDLLAACDHMRKHQPVVYHDEQQWYLFRHGDVLRVVEDHERFSNVVSTHLSVPNGMDPPEHTAYRPLIESFFDAQHMGDFEPRCRELSRKLLQELQGRSEVEVVSELAQPFALRVQCSFLSWPDSMEEKLGRWFASNQKAIREQDRAALAEHAEEFSNYIHDLLEERRHADTGDGGAAVDDVTDRLRRSKVQDRLLSDEEIVSILRNWTAGEVGTIAASVGILLHFLAENDEIFQQVRAAPEKLPEAIDEILRLHGPWLRTGVWPAARLTSVGARYRKAPGCRCFGFQPIGMQRCSKTPDNFAGAVTRAKICSTVQAFTSAPARRSPASNCA